MEQIENVRNALKLALRDYLDNLESGHSISIKGQTPCIEALQALDELESESIVITIPTEYEIAKDFFVKAIKLLDDTLEEIDKIQSKEQDDAN